MPRQFPKLAFSASVREAQERYGSRAQGARLEAMDHADDRLGPDELAFLAERDSFYLATVNEDGWPYVQFRGGPPGFLKALDERTLAFGDFRGNRQYVSTGNFDANDRVAMIFMDYANRRRLKVLARVEYADVADRPDLAERVALPDYPARVERVVLFHVAAFDWNCPQHITPRFTEAELIERGVLEAPDLG